MKLSTPISQEPLQNNRLTTDDVGEKIVPIDKLNSMNVVITVRRGKKVVSKLSHQNSTKSFGSSSFCEIEVPLKIPNLICGLVEIDSSYVKVVANTDHIPIYVDQKRLFFDQTVVVADLATVQIGRYEIVIEVFKSHGNDADTGGASLLTGGLNNGFDMAEISKNVVDSLQKDGVVVAGNISEKLKNKIKLRIRKAIFLQNKLSASDEVVKRIETEIFDEIVGLGALEPLLANEDITEVMVNGHENIYVEQGGKLTLTSTKFSSEVALRNVIDRIVSQVGRRLDVSSPAVDARLLDGSRVHAVIPPLALNGPCLTIRKFSKEAISMNQLIEWNCLSREAADFLESLVKGHKNIIVSGGTGSGKTTLLNALSSYIPETERIVTIEDAAELKLTQPHVVRLETRPANLEGKGHVSIRDLVKNSLRMRPDRIVVGECRGGESIDMLQAMNTGHDGSLTTAHANTPLDMLRRLETMVMMSGLQMPLQAIREQIASAICLVVQLRRLKCGKRLITHISWIKGFDPEGSQYNVLNLFELSAEKVLQPQSKVIEQFLYDEDIQ